MAAEQPGTLIPCLVRVLMFACRVACAEVAIRGDNRSRETRTSKGSFLARRRSMPSFKSAFTNGKRSRLILVAAAGTLAVATAASVAVATLPSGSAASSAASAEARLLADNSHVASAAQGDTMSAGQRLVAFDQERYGLAHRQAELEIAAKAAAAKAAKAAAARAAAGRAAAQHAAQQQAAQQQAAQQTAASTPSGSPQQIAQQMLSQFGWSSSQFSCLEPLWAHESGWSVSASNPSSGAYGIPQALPGSKMASAGPDWQSDAATQIRWGLQYIQGTYGSPCAAWSHEEADGWY
jgi:hypothetical protein